LLTTLVEWVLSAARVQPTVIAIEDLHWGDPSTLELLQLTVEQGATARHCCSTRRVLNFALSGRRGRIIRKSRSTG
jgi:predicted ATPase